MGSGPVRILVVDDSESWRQFVRSAVQAQTRFKIVGEASDGAVAVQLAEQLQPDLIILDIGLPGLNGFEAARLIRNQGPKATILFLSVNHSRDIVDEALRTGARGYVVKGHALKELIPAVHSVLAGDQFISAAVSDYVYA